VPGPLAITDTCREKCVNYNEALCSSGKSSMVFTLVKGMEENFTACDFKLRTDATNK
jgi:hypothetical protein